MLLAIALIDGASISVGLLCLLDCCVGRRPAAPAFFLEGLAAAIALDVYLQDGGVVDKAIDCFQRHSLIGEDLAPLAERLVSAWSLVT